MITFYLTDCMTVDFVCLLEYMWRHCMQIKIINIIQIYVY